MDNGEFRASHVMTFVPRPPNYYVAHALRVQPILNKIILAMYKVTLVMTILALALGIYIKSCNDEPAEVIEEKIEQQAVVETSQSSPQPSPPAKVVQKKNQLTLTKPPPVNSINALYPNLDDSYAPFDDQGNRYITQITIQGKRLTFHGDLLLGDLKDLEKFKKMKSIKMGKPKKWPQNKVPFQVESDMPVPGYLEEAVDYINSNTNIKFVPHSDEKDYVVFRAGEQNCYSYVGRTGGEQYVYLSGVCSTRSILHEMMHTLGFFHEQNREDRDEFVKVLWENIPTEHHMQFKKMPDDYMHVAGRPFNYNSIMLYPSSAFALSPDDPSIVKADGDLIFLNDLLLDEEDINRINELYPLQ